MLHQHAIGDIGEHTRFPSFPSSLQQGGVAVVAEVALATSELLAAIHMALGTLSQAYVATVFEAIGCVRQPAEPECTAKSSGRREQVLRLVVGEELLGGYWFFEGRVCMRHHVLRYARDRGRRERSTRLPPHPSQIRNPRAGTPAQLENAPSRGPLVKHYFGTSTIILQSLSVPCVRGTQVG